MAKRKGQQVYKTLVTPDTNLTFPVVDSNDIGGGKHIVDTVTERDSIPLKHLKIGMECYVKSSDKTYKLINIPAAGVALQPSDWADNTVPTNALTQHNTVEDIKYATPTTPDGFTKLIDELNKMKADIQARLTTHNKVEDIQYQNTTPFATLTAKLADMDSKITSASGVPHIEDINWNSAPTGHPASLQAELMKMNDPTQITVTNNGTSPASTVSLQAMLNSLVSKVPYVEDIIRKSDSKQLAKLLIDDAGAADVMVVNNKSGATPATLTLNARLAAIDSAVTAAAQNDVEDIDWGTAATVTLADGTSFTIDTNLDEDIKDLYKKLNDPKLIIVDDGSGSSTTTDLETRLSNIQSMAANAVQNVEDINWSAAPTSPAGIGTKLSDNIKDLYTQVVDMNDPTKIMVDTSATDPTKITLAARLNSIASAAAGVPDVESINWTSAPTSPAGINASLKQNIIDLFTKMNDPALINVDDGTSAGTTKDLATRIKELGTSVASINTSVTNINTSLTNTPQNVEDMKWKTAPAVTLKDGSSVTIDAALSTNIKDLYGRLNDAAAIQVSDGTASGTKDLATRIKELATAASGVPDVEDVNWKTAPSTTETSLVNTLAGLKDASLITITVPDGAGGTTSTDLKSYASEINNADSIQIDDGSGAGTYTDLTTAISNIRATIRNQSVPEHLLFTTAAPETGVISGLEYMTMYEYTQLTEVAFGVNVDATMATDLKFDIEICNASGTSYATFTGGSYTLATTDTGKYLRVDVKSQNLIFADNTRIRINITQVGSSDTIGGLNIRLTMNRISSLPSGVTTL